MGLRFIFMLTRNDKTVPEAAEHLRTALVEGVRHIGFKDVGLPVDDLRSLARAIRDGGATSYLEVVSLDEASELASARAAVEIGVDVLLGGTHVDVVLEVLKGTGIRYFPFVGRISGHPSVLEGSIEDIADSARALAAREGVDGLDLLAYRSAEDVPDLMRAVCAAAGKPVITAGSIDTPRRIAATRASGAFGFTIGTAALDGQYPAPSRDLAHQLGAIIRDVAQLNGHLSTEPKQRLADGFDTLTEPEHVAGRVGSMAIKLTRIEGTHGWHFHHTEDEMMLVHRGRLLIRFRDREEIVEEGEFIVVPHGVEHCPVALDGACDVMVIEPDRPMP